MSNHITRKSFLKKASLLTLGFSGLSNYLLSQTVRTINSKSIELIKDPNKIIDLPKGFEYKVISEFGDKMSDNLQVPDHADGMGCFEGEKNQIILVRNHEIGRFEQYEFKHEYKKSAFGKIDNIFDFYPKDKVYDPCIDDTVCFGGTTTVVYNTKTQNVENQYLSLAGTLINCSGGITPWNTWITCEETVATKNKFLVQDHGYNFEVNPSIKENTPTPLKAMGRFRHEAVAFDPKSGSVYQTEDQHNGMIYRFLPNDKTDLKKGGKLQGLAFINGVQDTRNWKDQIIKKNQSYQIKWIDIDNVESPNDNLRYQGYEKGCARFARPEGLWEHNGEIFFTCTSGGKKELGQIWKYIPSPYEGTPNEKNSPSTVELFFESEDSKDLDMCDNITVSPWGDIIICEDGRGVDYLIGIRPNGSSYKLAKNAFNKSEFAGACFSPDGQTLFVNIYRPTKTIAIRPKEGNTWESFSI